MSELYFRPGEPEGFTSKKLADKKDSYNNPIRELLQNSANAAQISPVNFFHKPVSFFHKPSVALQGKLIAKHLALSDYTSGVE